MRGAVIGTCRPVAAELFSGAEFSASRDINRPRVVRALSRIKCWSFDRPAVEGFPTRNAEPRPYGTGFGFSGIGGSRSTTLSMSPYSRASSGDMNRSRSVSS